jgi:outer membrane protein insertion porin family
VNVTGTYKFELVDVELGGRTGSSNRRVADLFSGGKTSSVRSSVIWDTRDNRLFPTSGFLQTAAVEVADDIIFSENEFVRYTGDSRWYFPIFWEFILKLNAEIGVVRSINTDKAVPIFERFFLGGPNNVRGFERATLGPTRKIGGDPGDPASILDDFNFGGNKKLVFNLELEFPIFEAVGIKGVFFADLGNAFDDGMPFAFTPDLFADADSNFDDTLRTSAGFGFRWFSPIGPLRFEWGFPLRPLAGEDPLVFEFSIGNAF